jgi:hypothetical protein
VRYPFLLALAIAALTVNASTERGTPAPAVGRRDCPGCGAPAVLSPPRRDPSAAATVTAVEPRPYYRRRGATRRPPRPAPAAEPHYQRGANW